MRTGKEHYVIGAISLISNELNNLGGELGGVTFKQWFLLLMISKMEKGRKTVNEIAEFAGSSRQNVKKMLANLKEKGFVMIEKSGEDGRALSVELTEKAYKLFFETEGIVASETRAIFAGFTEQELDLLIVMLKKLIDGIENYGESSREK